MAYDALEQWMRLNKAVNCKHYIGVNAHKCIQDRLEEANQATEPEVKKVHIENTEKPVKKAAKKAAKKSED